MMSREIYFPLLLVVVVLLQVVALSSTVEAFIITATTATTTTMRRRSLPFVVVAPISATTLSATTLSATAVTVSTNNDGEADDASITEYIVDRRRMFHRTMMATAAMTVSVAGGRREGGIANALDMDAFANAQVNTQTLCLIV